MLKFLAATLLWSLIFYVKGKYFDARPLNNDVDYVLEGVWMVGVPVMGLIYGGITMLIIKLFRKIHAKFKKTAKL